MDICYYCKNLWEDRSVGAMDCKKSDLFNEEDFEKYFVNAEMGCPYFEELREEEVYE